MHMLARGMLISVEGIDGSGKTTLCHILTQELRKEQFPIVLTKEPGGTAFGLHLREILQRSEVQRTPLAEYLLFAADRAQHFEEIIIPALNQNHIIISDRLTDSSLVYQGYGRNLDKAMIIKINEWVTKGIKPDLTLYIALPVDLALKRIHIRNRPLTAFEQEDRSFTERLIQGFEEVFANKTHVIRLDGTLEPEAIARHALEKVHSWIATHKQITPRRV